ncbi:MAG: FeoA family protein [Pseudomonadota bacterium]
MDSLATMKPGETAVIDAIHELDAPTQRLMSLGLVEGAIVEMAGRAIGGDPLEFRLFGCGISLRREQAQKFLISPAARGG